MTSTKEHILFTALKLILKKGYSNVSMSELVEASGLSKGAFYHYFKSKEAIYHDTLGKFFFSYMDSFDLTYDEDLSFRTNLMQVFTTFTGMAHEIQSITGPENPMISYYNTLLEGAIRSETIKEKITRYYTLWVKSIGEWIKIAQSKREINPTLDPELLSKQICALMEGIMIIYSFQEEEKDIEKYFNAIFYQFFELIDNNRIHENN